MKHLVLASAVTLVALTAGCGNDGAHAQALAMASQAAADRVAAEAAASEAAQDRAAAETAAREAAEAQEAAAAKAAADKAAAERAAATAAAERAAAEQAAADRAAAADAAARAAAQASTVTPSRTNAVVRSAPVSSDFDRAWALAKAEDITEDIATVDERLQDGIMVGSALSLLSGSFRRLASAGTPPKVDPAQYMARVKTLESFAATAADEMSFAPMDGSARYAVLRQETGVLFSQLNAALGTSLRLP